MFNLSRYFSTLSLVMIVLAGGLLGYFYNRLSVAQLVMMAEDRNVAMTNVFRNTLWPRYGEFLRHVDASDAGRLRAAPQIGQLHAEISAQMFGTDVIKAKVYNHAGRTVYSSDPLQIGEDKSGNAGFRAALNGKVASELTHRNDFSAFEGALSDLDVISSYIPIRNFKGEVEGVFELYQNVTAFLTQLRQTLWWIAGGVMSIFSLLYFAQFLVVRHAHRILREQGDELERTNRELDARVKERTSELESANQLLEAEIAERRTAEARLDHLAHHDPLTGLPNRLLFNNQLERSLNRAARNALQMAVLFIDLDHFKDVNDSLGHAIGDQLLKAVAIRLAHDTRAMDTLARLGGDEFICLIEDIHGPNDADTVARKILDQFALPFLIGENEFHLTASIGISLYPSDGGTVDALVRNADTAMYKAKSQGRNSSHFYAAEMTEYAIERLRLEGLLRRSIENRELSLHYQPQVDGLTRRLLGAEALVRWNQPELGAVSPVRFIPIAEETGFILTLGEWVLREACRQVSEWDRQGFYLPRISVNLSVKQIERSNIVELVSTILAGSGLAPERLELEITESVIMAVDDSLAILNKLRQLGIKLSVDDFGTGYSSLSYLKLLPISKLKIDRAFVVGIGENAGDEAIIRTIVALAQSLGLELIAEGVETAVQNEFLSSTGCPSIQGYLHGRPADPDVFRCTWE
ncbi:MAG: EAL domain-containing protein [Betaproteobacteria bacterium]|nr:EAL domain-containing protein [Betaproteobacteria bacterium]